MGNATGSQAQPDGPTLSDECDPEGQADVSPFWDAHRHKNMLRLSAEITHMVS